MSISAALGTAKTAITATQLGIQGWGLWQKWRYGSISITHPSNRDLITSEWFKVSGQHTNPKGNFWLFGVQGTKYWTKGKLQLNPDGRWEHSVGVGTFPGHRIEVLQVIWVHDFVNALLLDIEKRAAKA